jgi:hypothetical protein
MTAEDKANGSAWLRSLPPAVEARRITTSCAL